MKDKKVSLSLVLKAVLGLLVLIAVILVIIGGVKGQNLNTNSQLVNEIYAYLGSNDLEKCSGLYSYTEDKLEVSDVDEEIKICNAYLQIDNEKIDEVSIDVSKNDDLCKVGDVVFATGSDEDEVCSLKRVEVEEVRDYYYKVYGEKLAEYKTFTLDNTTVCQYDDGYYYCGLSEVFTYTIGNETNTYRKIKSARKSNDMIVIYDYFVKINGENCFTSFTGSTINEACKNALGEDVNNDFLKEYGTLYKHTFKLNDEDDYSWVSSEPE